MTESNNVSDEEIKELTEIYQIFDEIYTNAPPILKDLSDSSVDIDYTKFIHDPIDFKTINTKFLNGEYCSITDAVKDIRTVFINCYSFYGSRSDNTKTLLKLEALLEKKISCLEENTKLLADVNLTFHLLNMEGKPKSNLRYPKDCYDSILLRSVAHCRPERLKEYHRTLSTTLTTDKDNAHILEKTLIWDNEVYLNGIFHQYISSMWELPEIGHFVAIIFKKLHLDIINQGEIERMFLWPKESTTMGKIMTILLMPVNKTKFIGEIMPYEIWSEKLSCKISEWCKVYHAENNNKVNVMNSLGIHPDFWAIVNEKNPLIEKDYCELSYVMKVWIVKGLCDYATIKCKTINNIIKNCNERQCTIWKNEFETEEYFFFDSMPDLRIYYYNIPYDQSSLEFLKSVKPDKEVEVDDNISAHQKKKHFKLIADSVEGLRSFLNELDVEGSSVSKDLINALEKFIIKIESEECNFLILNNDSKVKMFKEWSSHPDRIKKELDDNISLTTENDQKSFLVQNEEIINGKRYTKSTIKQKFESDEFFVKNENISTTDLFDSQTKMLKKRSDRMKKKLYDNISLITENDQESPLVQNEEIINEKCCTESTIKQEFEFDESFIKIENISITDFTDSVSLLEENDSKLIAQDENKEIILKSQSRKLVVHQDFENEEFYETENYNNISKTGFIGFGDDLSAMNQPNNKDKQSLQSASKHLELETQPLEEGKMSNNDANKNDKSIGLVQLVNTENEVKNSNNTNILVNSHHNEKLVHSKNINSVGSDGALIDSDNKANENLPNNFKNVEIMGLDVDVDMGLDVDMQNDCEIVNGNLETTIYNSDEDETKKTSAVSIEDDAIVISDDEMIVIEDEIVISDDEMIVIEDEIVISDDEMIVNEDEIVISDDEIVISDDEIVISDDEIVISDDEDNVQFVPSTSTASSPLKITKYINLNKAYNSVAAYKRITPTKRKAKSPIIPRHSLNLPANIQIPKGIEITMVKSSQENVTSYFNSTKRRRSALMYNGHLPNDTSTVNVNCKIISKSDSSGEVTFYIRLPNGKEQPGPNELINLYLREHNKQLPDYWIIELPVEVARQYGL